MLTLDTLLKDISERMSGLHPRIPADRTPLDYLWRVTLMYKCPADIMNDWAVVLYCYKCKYHNVLMAEEIWKSLEKKGFAPAAANMDYVRKFRLRENRVRLGTFLRTPIEGNAILEAKRKKLLDMYQEGTGSPDEIILPPFPNVSAGVGLDLRVSGAYSGPYLYSENKPILSHDRKRMVYLNNIAEYRMMACCSGIILAECTSGIICAPEPSNIRFITDMLGDGFYAFGIGKHVKWSPSDRYVAITLLNGDLLILAVETGLYARVSPTNKSLEANSFEMMDDALMTCIRADGFVGESIPVKSMEWHPIPDNPQWHIPDESPAGTASRECPASVSIKPDADKPAAAGSSRTSKAGYDTKGMKWVRNRHKPVSRSEIVIWVTAAVLFITAILIKALS